MNYVLRIFFLVLVFPMVVQSTHKPLVFKPVARTEQSGKNCIIKFGTNYRGDLLSVDKRNARGIGDERNPIMVFSGIYAHTSVIKNGKIYDGPSYGGKILIGEKNILTIFTSCCAWTDVTNLKNNDYNFLLRTENAKKAVMSGNQVAVVESCNNTETINFYELPSEMPKKSWWSIFFPCRDNAIEGYTIYTAKEKEKIGPLALNNEGTKLTFAINNILYGTDLLDKKMRVHKLRDEGDQITSIVIPTDKQFIYSTKKPSVTIANIVNGDVIAHLLGNTFPIKNLVVGTSSKYGPIIAALGQKTQRRKRKRQNNLTKSEVCIWKNMLPELNNHLMWQKIFDDENINKQFGNFTILYK
jgi:hypothetical protein